MSDPFRAFSAKQISVPLKSPQIRLSELFENSVHDAINKFTENCYRIIDLTNNDSPINLPVYNHSLEMSGKKTRHLPTQYVNNFT